VNALARIFADFDAQPAAVAPQRAAAQALRAHSLPTRHDENWRYANLRALEGVRRFLPEPVSRLAPALAAVPPPLPGVERLVYLDGRLDPERSGAALAKLTRLPADKRRSRSKRRATVDSGCSRACSPRSHWRCG